jgi:hypothetical protein
MLSAACGGMLVGGCGGGGPEEGGFDPGIAEEFIRNKALADVRSNPALEVQDPQEPSVTCEETKSGEEQRVQATLFSCEVTVVSANDEELGRQTWEAAVEVDPVTNDSVVRSSRRIKSTFAPAPSP